MTKIFDGHNDALTRAEATALARGRDEGHLDVPRAHVGGLAGGIFAVFVDSAFKSLRTGLTLAVGGEFGIALLTLLLQNKAISPEIAATFDDRV